MSCLLLALAGAASPALTEDLETSATGWTSRTELSLVATGGNSDTQAFGFKERLERVWKRGSLKLRFEGVRSESRGDRFALLDPASYDPSLPLADQQASARLSRPAAQTEAEKGLFEIRYDREISERVLAYGGAGWDRNREAGILSRYQAFGGFGRRWLDREGVSFRTDAGLSFTHREDQVTEVGRDADFLGLRAGWDYRSQWTESTSFSNELVLNANLGDPADYRFDLNSGLTIAVNARVALQVGLQFLFENEPGLESLDAVLVDPQTGSRRTVGRILARKERLDRVFSTALVLHF